MENTDVRSLNDNKIDSLFKELKESVISCNKENVINAIKKAKGIIPATEIIQKGLSEGMNEVGILFERGKLYLPHVMMASEAMNQGVGLLKDELEENKSSESGIVVINGTVEGDVHDIGKNIVSIMLQVGGYEVIDVGRDVPLQNFIDAAIEHNAQAIGLSALMTTTMIGQRDFIGLLSKQGIREKVKVMVGGAPATQEWADTIGADCYAENAGEAVTKLNELLK